MTRRVLIIEDDPMLRQVLARICAWLELSAEVASDGASGIAALANGPLDLIITDLRMPGASGLDVVAAASRLDPRPAVLVVSGFVTSEDDASIAAAGASLLRKPFGAAAARTAIEAALARV